MWASFEHQLVIETKMAEGCSSHRGVVLDVRIEISIMSTLYLDVVLRILDAVMLALQLIGLVTSRLRERSRLLTEV